MMNNVTLIGRLATNPDIRSIPSNGQIITSFILAVDRGYSKEKRLECEAEGRPTADFIKVTFWGKIGETIAEYFYKSRRIAIKGEIRTGRYETAEGITRYTTEILGQTFEFVDWVDEDKLLCPQPYTSRELDNKRNRNENVVEDFIPYNEEIPF